jgi:hypothetical protein
MLVVIYQTKRFNNPEDRNISFACCLVIKTSGLTSREETHLEVPEKKIGEEFRDSCRLPSAVVTLKHGRLP